MATKERFWILPLDENWNPVIWGYDEDDNIVRPISVDDFWYIKTSKIWWNLVDSDILNTAWGVIKSSFDYSIFHSMWTYDVNGTIWKIIEDWVEVKAKDSTRVSSINWTLEILSWPTNWNYTLIQSFRSPRYQPNRWHLYSTSIFAPTYDLNWAHREYWIWFVVDWVVYNWTSLLILNWVPYFKIVSWWNIIYNEDVSLDFINKWIDISRLNDDWLLYDNQFQWRWVWDFFYYIEQKLIKIWITPPTWYVTLENPQLPAFFLCKNITAWQNVILRAWCVDITSEWGRSWALTDASFSNNDLVTISWSVWLPIKSLAIFRVNTLFKWKINTRNLRLLRLTASAYTKACKVWFAITRDQTAISIWNWVWQPVNDYSCMDVIDMSAISPAIPPTTTVDFTKTNISYKASIPAEATWEAKEPNEDLDFYLSWWDYVIIFARQIKAWTDAQADATIEFGEEI